MSNFEYPNADCDSCICNECNENIDKGGGCTGCATCNGKAITICPLGWFRNDYND